jgi:23S rRNA (cytosine1962-C5)-methyltransferase
MSRAMETPTVTVSARATARIRAGHPWVARPEVVRGPEGPGDVVRVVDGKRALLGSAMWSASSRIALRMFARSESALDEALIDERVAAALARRRGPFAGCDAYRVVHGEADLLPGLIVDRYGDVAVLQTTCAAMDAREPAIARVLGERLSARLVVARDDGAARDLEQLERRKAILRGAGPTHIAYHDAGSAVEVDVLTDGKTGGFLDQQENHARAATYVSETMDVLDTFTYHGGFALALARNGGRVLAVDESRASIDRARANAGRNGVALDLACANAFDLLRELEAAGRSFDLIVIDPPALAKRSSDLAAAERGYKELNLRGIRLLRPGGLLVTCSCSGKLTADRFARVVESAASDVGRSIQVLERRGAGRDHPPLLGVPETDYLKCWILRVIS